MGATSPYDITNNEQLRRIEERLSAQDLRLDRIEQTVATNEGAVDTLSVTVKELSGIVQEFAVIVRAVTNTFGWLKRGRTRLAAGFAVASIPLTTAIIQAIFRHFHWL